MPTYIYETIPESCCADPEYYEIEQQENDPPLTRHPQTGEPLKRVILDGRELLKKEGDEGSCGCGSGGCC